MVFIKGKDGQQVFFNDKPDEKQNQQPKQIKYYKIPFVDLCILPSSWIEETKENREINKRQISQLLLELAETKKRLKRYEG